MNLPDPTRIDRIALDTETTGLGFTDVPVGLSYCLPDGQADYLAWAHQGGSNNVSREQVINWLEDFQPGTIVYFHNAAYDLRMLVNIGVDLIAQGCEIRDTQYMAAISNELEPSYSLGNLAKKKLDRGKSDVALNEWCAEKFGGPATRRGQAKNYWRAPAHVVREYAIDDAVLTLALADYYERIMSEDEFSILEVEHGLIPVLHRMYQRGVRVNVKGAQFHYDRIVAEMADLERRWDKITGGVPLSGPGSRKELMKAWKDAGLSFATTARGNRSLTKAVLEDTQHPMADVLKAYRAREKVSGTFLKGYFLDSHHNGRIHPTFHPLKTDGYGAVSGRFSSSDPNFQNLPAPDRDDPKAPIFDRYGSLIRTLVLPESDEHQWAKLDYSQIEYRFFAHYAGGQIRAAYNDDPDIDFHGWCAETAGVTRSTAKNGNFAKLYGAGVRRLASTLGVGVEEARVFIAEYDKAIPEAARLYNGAMNKAARRGWIMTWGGRKRRFRRSRNRFEGTHAALNALLQGSAADLMKKAMIAVERELVDWDEVVLHLTVHDELDLSIPKGEAGLAFLRKATEIMSDFALSVPIKADAEVGPTWGEVAEVEL